MYEANGALFIETAAGQGDLIVDGTRVGGALRDLEAKVATCCAETAKLRLEHAREIAEEVCPAHTRPNARTPPALAGHQSGVGTPPPARAAAAATPRAPAHGTHASGGV